MFTGYGGAKVEMHTGVHHTVPAYSASLPAAPQPQVRHVPHPPLTSAYTMEGRVRQSTDGVKLCITLPSGIGYIFIQTIEALMITTPKVINLHL